jgi:DNA-binding protein H-NS
MAVQILPGNSLGERLGTALGTGLSAGIQGLAQHKLSEIEQQKGIRKTASGLQALGAPAELANLPENLQQVVLKQFLQQPGQNAYASALSSLLGAGQSESKDVPNLQGLNQQQASELTKIGLQKQKATAQEKQFEEKQKQARLKEFNAETREYRQTIKKAGRANRDDLRELDALEARVKKGNLPNPIYYSVLEKIGLDFPALLSTDANVYNKGIYGFIRNLKDAFGARPTNFDVATYFKTLATLSQTDEGKLEIIKLQKLQKQAGIIRNDALNKVLAKNKDIEITPDELEEQVEKISGKKLDKLWQKYTDEISGNATKLSTSTNADLQTSPNQQGLPNLAEQPGKFTGTQLSQAPGPSRLQEAGRHLARSTARGLESVANIPGDIASLGLTAADLATLGKVPQIGEANKFIRENLNARNITKALTGEVLEPQTETEKKSDEIVSDLATFLAPVKGKIPFKSAVIKTALGNTASFLAEKVGAGPLGQAVAKIGSVLLYSFSGGRKALEEIKNTSGKTIDKLAGSVKTTVPKLEKDIEVISREVARGFKTDAKSFINDRIGGLKSLIENGKASVKELWDEKVNLNELFSDPNTPPAAKKYIGRIVGSINEAIDKYGKKNKAFGEAVHKVNDIHRGLNQASDIAKTIQKDVKTEKLTSPLIKSILYGAAFKAPGVIPAAGAALGAGLGIQKFTRFTQLLKNSGEAKKYYKNLVQAAARENASLVQRYARKLDEIATKEGY